MNLYYYDGIIKGKDGSINGTITETETDYVKEDTERVIDNENYIVATLIHPIIINYSKSPTQAPIIASIAYSSSIVSGKKAGFGTTLVEAQAIASAENADNVTITSNGYVYAEGLDSNGNTIFAYEKITTIIE